MPSLRWTSRRRAAFLVALADTGNVSAACRAAKVSRSRAYELKSFDKGFAEEWEEALETATDAMDADARRRAVEGVETPHFHQGRVCGTVRKYSDSLLMFLLRAHRPERYRERTAQNNDSDDNFAEQISTAKDTLEERLARLDAGIEPEETGEPTEGDE